MIEELACILNPEIYEVIENDRSLKYQVIRKLNESSNDQMLVVRDLINNNQLRLAQKIDMSMTRVTEENREKCLKKLKDFTRIGELTNESMIEIKAKFEMNERHLILISYYYEVYIMYFFKLNLLNFNIKFYSSTKKKSITKT